jgi:hypothetical protein
MQQCFMDIGKRCGGQEGRRDVWLSSEYLFLDGEWKKNHGVWSD